MRSRWMGFILLALLIVSLGWHAVRAQSPQGVKRNSDPATKQFESIVVEGQMVELFSKLALEYDIPIGIETAFEPQDLSNYRLELTKGTLSELLDQFVKQNLNYAWFVENGVVNIFPTKERRDPIIGEVLSVRLKKFSIEKGTGALDMQDLLFDSPEIKAILDRNGVEPGAIDLTGFYLPQLGQEFSLRISNPTTREILNQTIKESPIAKVWIVSRDFSAGTLQVRRLTFTGTLLAAATLNTIPKIRCSPAGLQRRL